MSEQNKLQARRFFEEAWNRGDLAVLDEILAGDYVGHAPTGDIHGREGGKQLIVGGRRGFPDIHFTIEDELAEGDRVAFRWTSHGTHLGEFQGIPPTGKPMVTTGMSICRVASGKLIETWTNGDMLSMLQQLGVIPAPGQSSR